MVACCGRDEGRCGWTVVEVIACCGVSFCGIEAAEGGVCESELAGTETLGVVAGREGGAV
jgi:hypothetical protein